jgi:hypothetical protein
MQIEAVAVRKVLGLPPTLEVTWLTVWKLFECRPCETQPWAIVIAVLQKPEH